MAYENLKNAIKQVIKQNGNQEITGPTMQSTLLSMVDILGEGATFAGIATPATDPGTPEGNVFYVAINPGIYANFGNLKVDDISIIKRTGNSWQKLNLFYYTDINATQNALFAISADECTFGSTFKTPTVLEGKLLRKDGTLEDAEGFLTTDKIEKDNKVNDNIPTYVVVEGFPIFDSSEYIVVALYDKNDNMIGFINQTICNNIVFSIQGKAVYARVSYFKDSNTNIKIYSRGNVSKNKLKNLSDEVSKLKNLNSKWSGKKILCIGDSITDDAEWVNSLNNIIKPSAMYNRGVGGTTIAGNSELSFCNRADLPRDDSSNHRAGFPNSADLIIVYGGINDWGFGYLGNSFGDIDGEISKTTFCGAVKYLFAKLKSYYPDSKIVSILNYNVYGGQSIFDGFREINYTDGDETKGFTYVEHNGKTAKDYRNAMLEISSQFGIPCIDMRRVGFSFWKSQDREKYSYYQHEQHDGLHPNDESGKIMAEYIAKHLNLV